MQTVKADFASAISTFGAGAKAKLSNPSVTGEPEEQLRAPLERRFANLAKRRVVEAKWVAEYAITLGEKSSLDLTNSKPYAQVPTHAAIVATARNSVHTSPQPRQIYLACCVLG